MILGAHRGTSGGLHKAVESARELGFDAVQVFTRQPQRWAARALTHDEADTFRQACRDLNVIPLAHDIYLTNFASANEEFRAKSVISLKDQLVRCKLLGISRLITHCGSCAREEAECGMGTVAASVRDCMQAVDCEGVTLLLEATAGQGGSLGSSFEQLARMLELIDMPSQTGICIDTCHLFAAGYDLRTADAFAATFERFDRIVGMDKVQAVHINDCKKDLGSRVDRHEHIGEGKLGIEAFRLLLADPRFQSIPLVLETDPDRHADDRAALLAAMGS